MHHDIVVLYVEDLRNLDRLEKEMGLTQCHKEGEVTLNDLKARKINPKTQAMFERTMELWHGNILVHQRRMAMEEEREYEAMNMTHDGNDPKSSEQMLDDAKMYIEKTSIPMNNGSVTYCQPSIKCWSIMQTLSVGTQAI